MVLEFKVDESSMMNIWLMSLRLLSVWLMSDECVADERVTNKCVADECLAAIHLIIIIISVRPTSARQMNM